jgi:hypothetical protein
MFLTANQISKNYQECYELTSTLLQKVLNFRGHQTQKNEPEIIDLIQSVIGHESIVELIQYIPFNLHTYQPLIIKTIDEVKKSLFPDVSKKRYFSINNKQYKFLENQLVSKETAESKELKNNDLTEIQSFLHPSLVDYFKNKLRVNNPFINNKVICLPKNQKEIEKFKKNFNQKIYLFKKFYPDGKIDFTINVDVNKDLRKVQIIDVYLKVYLDIEKFYPKNFLKKNTERRSAILTKFLIEEIIESSPQSILEQKDETLFIKHKLQNIYRFFNYSFNRVLGNAYPELIHPWLQSRTPSEYWQNIYNRKNAIKWLVEEKLNYSPDCLYKEKINRKDFANNGLSFLFNNFYNSVSAALADAYPEKYPWELGNVPLDYWTDNNSISAIHWLVKQKSWEIDQLPAKVQYKEFNRKTFSEFGLATLFEKKFNKNIYNAISLAYPKRFYPWEFGKVPSKYWMNNQNIFHASKWIAEKENFAEENIVHSIREGKLTFRILEKYSIGRVLKKMSNGKIEQLFGTLFWKEQSAFLEEQRILRKIKTQNNRFFKLNIFRIFLYGLFAGEVTKTYHRQQRSYRRISQRISSGYFN